MQPEASATGSSEVSILRAWRTARSGHIKWELEDLSFPVIFEACYNTADRQMLDGAGVDRQEIYRRCSMKQLRRDELEGKGIHSEISAGKTYLFHWRKMRSKGIDCHQVYDVRAVRVYGAAGP